VADADGKENYGWNLLCTRVAGSEKRRAEGDEKSSRPFSLLFRNSENGKVVPRVETEREKAAPEIPGLRMFHDESI
jgi:hypothetical protein